MGLKKYVKDNIYGLPENMIGNDEINGFKYYMAKENPDYLNDILSEIDAFDLVEAIALNHEHIDLDNNINVIYEAIDIRDLVRKKIKEEILNYIDEIREDEEGEEDDHGTRPTDFLMGKL